MSQSGYLSVKKQKLKLKAELKTVKGPVSLTGEPTGAIKVIIGNSLVVVIHDARMLTYPKLETEQQHRCMPWNHLLVKKIFIVGFCLFVCFTTELANVNLSLQLQNFLHSNLCRMFLTFIFIKSHRLHHSHRLTSDSVMRRRLNDTWKQSAEPNL